MLSYLLIGFFIDIGFNNIIEGSNIAFEPMKIYFNFACLHKFTNLPLMAQSGRGGGSKEFNMCNKIKGMGINKN
jgi:hypothetical protein